MRLIAARQLVLIGFLLVGSSYVHAQDDGAGAEGEVAGADDTADDTAEGAGTTDPIGEAPTGTEGQVEQTAETYKPNPSPEQAIRSQQTAETQSRDAGAQGVPGALTNQPPVPATAPITNPAVAGAAGANGQLPLNSTRNATTNYELDKTVAHVRRALGQVKRLSVAVVVNHRTSTQANGRTETTPLTDQEIERITNLVKEAVGYSEARGDTLNVASSPFAEVVKTDEPALPLWKDPENLALAKEGIKYLLLLAVVAFVAFGVIRPLMKTVTKSAEEEQAEAVEGAGEEGGEEGEEGEGAQVTLTPEAAAAQQFEEKLARARELARDDPRVIANLIKEWMGSNEQR